MATAAEILRKSLENDDTPEERPAARRTPNDVIETRRQDEQYGLPGGAGPAPSDLRPSTSEVGTMNSAARQFLRGVVDVAAPTVSSIRPTAGVPSVGEIAEARGVPSDAQGIAEATGGRVATEDPQTLTGRAARFAGSASTAAPGIGGVSGTVSRSMETGGPILTRFFRGLRNLVSEGGRAFRSRPGRFTAGETSAGAGAGAGGYFVEQAYPDSDAAQVVGELAGGIVAQGPLVQLGLKGAQRARDAATGPFTQSAARGRAQTAMEGVQTRSEQGRMSERLDQPTTVDRDTGEPVLTPAQRTGSEGMLSLERSVRQSRQELARESEQQMATASRKIQEAARRIPGEGSPQDTAAMFEGSQQRLLTALNERMKIAGQRIDERIAQLGQGASREQANRVAREEVESALKAAREQEKELFQAVDMDTAVPTSNAQQAMSSWKGELGRAQTGDIPANARSMLNPESKVFMGEQTTIREMRSLQSKLREQARRARSNDQFTKARVSDDIADAITEDIAAAGDDSEALQTAVAYSKQINQNFRQGAVGKVLGREASGGQSVAAGQTLESTIGGGGPGGREALDQIRQALTDPTITARTGGDAETFNQAASDYVRQLFLRQAAPQGELNPKAGQNFLRQNDELLGRMPEVRQELEAAVHEGNIQRIVSKRRQSTTTLDPSKSRTTLFIRKGPEQAFREITDDAPDRAARQTQELLNRTQKDPTGRASSGLKRGYIDFLMRPQRQRDVEGEHFVDAFGMRDLRQTPSVQAAERRLLSKEERDRLDVIQRDLINLQRAREAKSVGELPVSDQPGKMRQRLARIAGAATGRQSAAMTGSGGTVQIPGQVADIFNDLVNAGFEDPAGMLLRDAVDDEALFRELLEAQVGPDGQLPQKAQNRLNAWAAGVLAQHQDGTEDASDQPATIEGGTASDVLRRSLDQEGAANGSSDRGQAPGDVRR